MYVMSVKDKIARGFDSLPRTKYLCDDGIYYVIMLNAY